MKQKRKVKSLLPQWNESKTFLMLSLLILWLVLCLWSLSLLTTSSVWAIWKDINKVSYSWLDDVTEVLYHMDLADPKQLDKKVGEMYYKTSEWTFYIAWPSMVMNSEKPLASQKNEIGNDNFSNILWWAWDKVYSDNVTVIWGSSISVAASNDDAVVLWWEWNKIIWNGWSDPVIMIWWSDNTIKDGHDGDAIIWWSHNTIESSVSNSFILWWNTNTVSANNVIVWGSNVTVDAWIDNVFVYSSDWSFKPNKAKTFYLNVANWLWVNMGSNKPWLSVKWPVRFGNLDISEACDDDSLWVIWMWDKCLVGCTTKSKAKKVNGKGKWELLDRWKICQDVCEINAERCYNEMEKLEEPDPYTSYCSEGVDTSNASPCTPVWNSYNNVVFETSLIDADVACPTSAPNKCIYQCDKWYHLRYDETGKFPSNKNPNLKCFKDCNLVELLWREEWKSVWNNWVITHNDTVVAYNKDSVACSYHKYTPPLPTYSDYLDNGYGTKWDRRGWIGQDINNRRYLLPETCTNNAHEQNLVCVNWELFITNKDKKTASTILATKGWTLWDSYLWYEHNGYIYKTCKTTDYSCDLWQYDLSEKYIRETLEDEGMTYSPKDRNTIFWTRWKYKLCLDYKSNWMWCDVNVLTSSKNNAWDPNVYDNHYEFKWCMDKYHLTTRTGDLAVDPRICRKECSLSIAGTKPVWDQQSITLYKESNKDCSVNNDWKDVCEHHTFQCIDGKWTDEELLPQYTKVSCYQKWEACAGYNVTPETYAAHNKISIYKRCHKWTAFPETNINWTYTTIWDEANHWYLKKQYENIQDPCIDWWDHYKLDWCVNCHHATNDQYCDEDVENVEFDGYCSPVSNWTAVGYKYRQWNLTRYNWSTSNWTNQGKCEFYCDEGYYKDWSSCSQNPTMRSPTKPTWEKVDEETRISNHKIEYRYTVYRTNSVGVLEKVSSTNRWFRDCESGYHRVNQACERIIKSRSCMWTKPLNSTMVWGTTHYGFAPKEYGYDENGWDCAFKCNVGYSWNGYACIYDGWNCDVCNHRVTFDWNEWIVAWPSERDVVCGEKLIMPDATRDCYRFNWWSGMGSLKKKWDQVEIKYNLTFRADWTYDAKLCSYTCGLPAPTSTDVEMSTKKVEGPNLTWKHVNETPRSTALNACEWRCNEWLDWDGNLGCKNKECAKWNLPSNMKWVVRWPVNYRWTTDSDVRKWKIWSSYPLQACEWACDDDYEHYTDKNWVKRCTRTVNASCSLTERYGCEVDWNTNVDDDGYSESTDHKAVKKWSEVIGWTWTCKWSPSWEDRDCHICNFEEGYKERMDADWNRECVKCNNCAKNGFPYCFPIDFSDSCDESDYYYNYGD